MATYSPGLVVQLNAIAIDWEEKVRFDRKNFLIKSVALKLTNKGMNISDVELITMQ